MDRPERSDCRSTETIDRFRDFLSDLTTFDGLLVRGECDLVAEPLVEEWVASSDELTFSGLSESGGSPSFVNVRASEQGVQR